MRTARWVAASVVSALVCHLAFMHGYALLGSVSAALLAFCEANILYPRSDDES